MIKKKFTVQAQIEDIWLNIQPTNGRPYTFDTEREAQEFIDTWYCEAPLGKVRIGRDD